MAQDNKKFRSFTLPINLDNAIFSVDGQSWIQVSNVFGRLNLRFGKTGVKDPKSMIALNRYQAAKLAYVFDWVTNKRVAEFSANKNYEALPETVFVVSESFVNGEKVVFGKVSVGTVEVEGVHRVSITLHREGSDPISVVLVDRFDDGNLEVIGIDGKETTLKVLNEMLKGFISSDWLFGMANKLGKSNSGNNGYRNNNNNNYNNNNRYSGGNNNDDDDDLDFE